MDYKLLCTDIDGTLLNKNRQLSLATIQQMERIKDKIPIILISSRMPKAMRHLQNELGISQLPLIAYNGGLVLDGNTILESTVIPNDVLEAAYQESKRSSIHLSLYHNDDWFVPDMDYWAKREQNNTKVTPLVQSVENTLLQWTNENKGAHKIMAMGDANEIEILYTFLEDNYADTIALYRSKDTYIEIAHRSISKETAIRKLLQENYPKSNMKDIIAFGDNYNDIEMLKAVGMGIAVGNARPEVLEIADKTTEANIDDGVAIAIKKYVQIKR